MHDFAERCSCKPDCYPVQHCSSVIVLLKVNRSMLLLVFTNRNLQFVAVVTVYSRGRMEMECRTVSRNPRLHGTLFRVSQMVARRSIIPAIAFLYLIEACHY